LTDSMRRQIRPASPTAGFSEVLFLG
jgi:hypothetical protein